MRPRPAVRRAHRHADAVVLADEQHGDGHPLVRRPRRGIERALRRRVVQRGVAERAEDDRVGLRRDHAGRRARRSSASSGDRWRGPCPPPSASARRSCSSAGHPHCTLPNTLWRPPDRIRRGSGQREEEVLGRVLAVGARRARTRDEEGAAAVVEERRVGRPGQGAEGDVPFVARAADRVVALVARAQLVRLDVRDAAKGCDAKRFCASCPSMDSRGAWMRPWPRPRARTRSSDLRARMRGMTPLYHGYARGREAAPGKKSAMLPHRMAETGDPAPLAGAWPASSSSRSSSAAGDGRGLPREGLDARSQRGAEGDAPRGRGGSQLREALPHRGARAE